MAMVKTARDAGFVLAALMLCVLPAFSQTSLGFENPGDTTNILEYRLPDWGFRTWDLGFDLNGFGADYYQGDRNTQVNNRLSTRLSTRFSLYRESEARTYNVLAGGSGIYQRARDGSSTSESSGHDLRGDILLRGDWTQYKGDSPLFLRAAGNLAMSYAENTQEYTRDGVTEEFRNFQRDKTYGGSLGAGLGRVRDVTPLIRAQRLSERLGALGRDRLTPGQVQEIAQVLATEQGYRMVFDRPEKSFWRDVLEPMLDPDKPLSPYEIFYLRDIMNEDIGPREEGTEVWASVFYRENENDGAVANYRTINKGPSLDFRWVRNFSFDHQLTLRAGADYSMEKFNTYDSDRVMGNLDLLYLWTIADRYRWDTAFLVEGVYNESTKGDRRRIERDFYAVLQSKFTIFIENSLAMNFSVRGANNQAYTDDVSLEYQEEYERQWSWAYGIGFTYFLDRVLN